MQNFFGQWVLEIIETFLTIIRNDLKDPPRWSLVLSRGSPGPSGDIAKVILLIIISIFGYFFLMGR
jgi:hypothetical protein